MIALATEFEAFSPALEAISNAHDGDLITVPAESFKFTGGLTLEKMLELKELLDHPDE